MKFNAVILTGRRLKSFFSCCLGASALSLAASVIPLDNGPLKMEFDTTGGSVGKLVFQEKEMSLPRLSVTDKLFSSSEAGGKRHQIVESLSGLDFSAKETRSDRETVMTFSARGIAAFDWCRVTKTYTVPRGKSHFSITWKLENLDTKAHSAGVWTATSFRRMDGGKNIYRQVRGAEEARLEHPGKVNSDEWSLNPGLAYLAVEGQDKAGLLLTLPPELFSAAYNWFSQAKTDSTLEWFIREQDIPAGKSVEYTVNVQASADIPALISKMNLEPLKVKSSKGREALLPVKYAKNDAGITEGESKKASMEQSRKYFDVTGARQYCDSVRGARISADVPAERLGVYEKRNNQADYDRPVPFTVKALPSGEKQLLFLVPGLNPDGYYYTGLENGRAQNRRARNADLGENAFSYRIELDRAPGVKADDSLRADRADLVYNGSFEKMRTDAAWPEGFNYHYFLRSRNLYFLDETNASDGKYSIRLNRPDEKNYCFMVNHFRVEENVSYHASAMVKCDNPIKGISLVSLEFFDASGKRIGKISLLESKEAYGWRKVERTFFAPKGALFASFTFGIYGVREQNLYIDDMQIVPEDFLGQPKSRRELLREQLVSGDYKPLDHLEKISHEVETPHEKWLKPSAFPMPEVLYLTTFDATNEDTARRQIVELCQRMDLKYRYIPLLRAMESFPGGIFGVNTHIKFAPYLEDYTMECLKGIEKTPALTIVQAIDLKNSVQKEFIGFLRDLQKKGSSILFLNCQNIPQELLGEKIQTPPEIFLVPQMRKLPEQSLARACSAYRNGGARVIAFHHFDSPYYMAPGNFPSTPLEMSKLSVPAYYGKDYPYWEYIYLSLAKSLRWLAGDPSDALFTEAKAGELVIDSKKPMEALLRVVCKDMHRETEGSFEQKVTLGHGLNTVKLNLPALPGGTHIAEYFLLNGKKQLYDAGAMRFDTPETVRIGEVAFANPDRCFDLGKPVALTIPLSGDYAGTEVVCMLEDTENRLVASQTLPAKPENRFSFVLKAPYTMLYRVKIQVRKDGRLLARKNSEFSAPFIQRDLADVSAVIWIQRPEMNKKLRDLGFDSLIAGYSVDGTKNGLFQNLANLNMRAVTMGSGYVGGGDFRTYNCDRQTDPVRKPCFHDPAYQGRIKNAIFETADKHRFRYYNIKEHFLGDESYIGSTVCYSPYCLSAFRESLKQQYGSLDALNKGWESAFRSWEEVRPVQLKELTDKHNLSRWLDHKMFMSGVFAHRWLGQIGSWLDEAFPGSIAGLSGTQNPGYSYDWAQLMKHCNLLSYYDGVQCKVVHDFAPPRFVNGQWGGGYTPMDPHEVYQKCSLWINLLRGANLHAHYHGNAINGDIAPTENLIFYSDTIREMKRGIGKLFLSAQEEPAQIAVLYSQASFFASLATIGASEWQNAQSGWNTLLGDLKYRYRFLSYEDLKAGRIGAEFLILPASLALSGAETAAIRKFVENGGTVIADILPGWFDEHGKKSASPAIAELFGKQPETLELAPLDVKRGSVSGKFRAADASAPVMQVRKLGKGKAVLMNLALSGYMNIELGGAGGETSTARSGPEALCHGLRSFVTELISAPEICKVADAGGNLYPCTTVLRKDGDNYVFGILKYSIEGSRFDLSKNTPVTVTLPVEGYIYDVRNGLFVGKGRTIQTKIVPGYAQIFTILKEKAESVDVKVPAKVRRGALLPLEVRAGSGSQVFHLEFAGPDGKNVPAYAKNLRFASGGGSCAFQTALNDPPGRWMLRVVNVNTGLSKERPVDVE